MNGWKQTLSVILSVVSTAIASSIWLQGQFYKVETRLVAGEVERAAMLLRVTEGGFSRVQAQRFIDELRERANHPVPTISRHKSTTE